MDALSLSQLQPRVNFANYNETKKAWGPRTIPDTQLLFVLSGRAELTLGAGVYPLRAGDCIFYGTDSPHRIRSTSAERLAVYSIHFSWNGNADSPDPVLPHPKLQSCPEDRLGLPPRAYAVHVEHYGRVTLPHHLSCPEARELFHQIVNEYRREEPGYMAEANSLLKQILVLLVRKTISGLTTPAQRHKIEPALQAMLSEPSRHWTTPMLASLCGYHPTYFAEQFKAVTGCPPQVYQQREKLRLAKHYLTGEAEPIGILSEKLGFANIHYFSRWFKQATGVTPTAYRGKGPV